MSEEKFDSKESQTIYHLRVSNYMSYRKQNNKSYAAKRRMFNPSAWTSGFQGAMDKAAELAHDGWIVETDQGALDPKQAEDLSKEAKRRGYDTQVIPIVKDGDDIVAQFVAVKQKAAAPAAAQPVSKQASPPVNLNTAIAPEEVEANFIKEFYAKGRQPDGTQADNGFIMAPNRTTCLIRRDASPQTKSPLVDSSIDTLKTPWGGIDAEAVAALGLAKNTKKQVIFGPAGGEVKANIDVLLKGVRSLGGSTSTSPGRPIKIAAASKDGVIFLGNTEGDRVCIAPVIGPNGPEDIAYNDALSNYRSNIGS